MPVAQEIDQVAPGIFIWQVYDPTVKADLFSTVLETPSGAYLVDPVGLGKEAGRTLEAGRKVGGIIVTNENHERAARLFADNFSVPVFLHAEATQALVFPRTIKLENNGAVAAGLTTLAIEGGPAGEIALYYEADGGTMVIGDALINFEPHGFTFLPAKYCRDFKLMGRSLAKLLDRPFERMLFAHGTPILSGAHARLAQLLGADR